MNPLKYLFPTYVLQRKIARIEIDIEKAVSEHFSGKFYVLQFGDYKNDPKNLMFWVCVETNAIKEDLSANEVLDKTLRSLPDKHEYPSKARKYVMIRFESQESVEVEAGGSWYHHFYKKPLSVVMFAQAFMWMSN